MRIVAGRFRGHRLTAPFGPDTRPTSDRLREAIFNILSHGKDRLEGARVLDLFAGTGAMGLEALSRGAQFALFVEQATAARGAIRANIETLGLTGQTRLFRRDATRLGALPANAGGSFDLVFVDPPYRHGLAERALASAEQGGWLAPGAVVVIESASNETLALAPSLTVEQTRHYGDTTITLARFRGVGDQSFQ